MEEGDSMMGEAKAAIASRIASFSEAACHGSMLFPLIQQVILFSVVVVSRKWGAGREEALVMRKHNCNWKLIVNQRRMRTPLGRAQSSASSRTAGAQNGSYVISKQKRIFLIKKKKVSRLRAGMRGWCLCWCTWLQQAGAAPQQRHWVGLGSTWAWEQNWKTAVRR